MTDFAKEVQERRDYAARADKTNRDEALIDLKFEAGEHWDERTREYREKSGVSQYGFPLPCLTINDIPQKVGQVTGDWQANSTSLKALPKEDGDKIVAETRTELIRSIELQSKAQRAYLQSYSSAVSCGIGNLRVDIKYAREDAFDRDVFIGVIPNPLAVLWDPMAADPTGKDATFCIVEDRIQREDFKRRFGKEAASYFEGGNAELTADGWLDDETVRVAEYWTIDERDAVIAMMQDGSVINVTDKPREMWLPNVLIRPDGRPMIREDAKCSYAVRRLTNGRDELEDKFEVKVTRLPIIKVTGREIWVENRRVRYGLTRFARDPARLKDYWRSVIAEKLMLSPRANFIAPASAIAGRTDDWKNTLVYNDNASAPPVAMTQNDLNAIMQEAQFCSQDMKDVTGLHDASLGIQSNETSGIAIQRRQNEGDIATIHYRTNMLSSMQEVGEVVNCFVDITYDTARTIRTVGVDDSVKLVKINYQNDPESIDLSKGRYDVTISTGPEYQTQLQEQATQLMELASRNQKFAEVVPDYIVKALGLKHSDEMAERLKRTIPPEILGEEKDDDKTPEEIAANKQKADQAQAMAQHMADLQRREAEAKVAEAEAKARKAVKEADDAEQGINKQSVDAHNAETQRLKAVTAKDFPLPPSAVAMLAPVVTKAIMDALSSPDALPFALHAEIAEEAYDQAEDSRVRANAPPEIPNEEQAA